MLTHPPRYAVLGPLEVATAAGAPLTLRGGKLRILLSLLVLHRNRAVPTSRLVAGLWGDDPPRGAEVTLRSHVSHLRQRLADVAGDDALSAGPAGYRLAVPPGEVDVDRFEELVGLAQEALGLGRPQRAAGLVQAALQHWRGRPFVELEDVDDLAATAEAARLEELRLAALEVLAAAELDAGRHREVVADLVALVDAHPFRERFCAQLMVALYRSGRQAEALAAYATTRERLADELGLDPSPQLQALNQRVLRQDPVLLGDAELPAPPPSDPSAAHRRVRGLPDAVFSTLARQTLVGRERESARLDSTWESVVRGDHRLVLLSGAAGIGKSHLTAGLARRAAEEGHCVLVGRCAAAGVPYEPVAAALRRSSAVEDVLQAAPPAVRQELAPLLDDPPQVSANGQPRTPDASEAGLYSAAAVVLRRLASDGPMLVVVENAERIDHSSALLLRHLLARLLDRVLMLLSFRDPPGGRHAPLLTLLGDPGPGVVVERLHLGPLSEQELADLVRATLPEVDQFAQRLWQHTGGNPLYAKGMAHALADRAREGTPSWDVPVGVRDALRHRLQLLSETAREVLPVAAALGAEVDFELLARVVHQPEDRVAAALDEAVAEGLLVESGSSWAGRYAFPQDLVREALGSTLDGFRLRSVHLKAAEALISQPRQAGSAAIAGHLRAAVPAADPLLAARYSLAAAGELRSAYAWDDAVEHAEAAVGLLDETAPPSLRAEAALTAAMLRLKSGRGYPQAVAELESALRSYLGAGDQAAAGAVHSRLGGALCLHHSVMDVPRALEHFDAAERLVPTPEAVYHLHRGRSQAAMFGLRTGLLAESATRAAALAAALGRRDLTVVTGWAMGWAALNLGQLAEAAQAWEGAWRVAHEYADPYLGWGPVNAAALASNAYLLDPRTARAWCRRGLGQPGFTAFADPHNAVVDQLALAHASMGELDAARQAAEHLPEDAVATRMLLFLDGRWEDAEAAWASAAAADDSAGDLHDAALNLRWLASARLALGDRRGADTALQRALSLACDGPQVPTELDVRAALAQLHALDSQSVAEQHLVRCEQILAGGENWAGARGPVELARAAVAAVQGDHDTVDQASASAVEVFTDFHLPWRRAAALGAWARLLHQRGSHSAAEQHRRRAVEGYASLGAADRWQQVQPL